MPSLCEEAILGFGDLHSSRALLVIVGHVIDATAHGVELHLAGVIGLQQFRDRGDVLHSGVEPEIERLRIENDWHSVVDGRGQGIGFGG